MRLFVFGCAVAGAALCCQGTAFAYERPYCMEIAYGGGGSTIDCSYDSFEQCLKWKVDISSTCWKNPRWVGPPPRQRKSRPLR